MMPLTLLSPVLWHGIDRKPATPLKLRAGPLTMLFEPDLAFLRYIRLGDREVLRGIYSAVRDHDWGTVSPHVSNLNVQRADESFHLTFDATCRHRSVDFVWCGTITGDADGTVAFSMKGVARSSFLRNRIGFCVLHPITECAGRNCRVEKVDGSVVQGRFPEYISPHQPFKDIRSISHEVAPGVWAEVRLEGDVFEMEDQRNWTDASFKTYCTPLSLPFPVQIAESTTVVQAVELSLSGPKLGTRYAPPGGDETVFEVGGERQSRLPHIGLQTASHGQPLEETELERLRELNLSHLRVDLPMFQCSWSDTLARAADEARALGVALEAALFLGPSPADELEELADKLAVLRPRLAHWLVFHVGEGSTSGRWIRLARRHLTRYGHHIPVGAGARGNFTELNRSRPPVEALDLVCYSANPQVHAFDSRSLVETLPIHTHLVKTARTFVGSLPIAVTPLTLGPSTTPATPSRGEGGPTRGELPPSVDARQMSLFGAGWTLGSLKYLAEAGVHSVTYYETTGWRGVMETMSGSPLPEAFRSLPGAVFPVYHVLADAGEWPGAEVLPTVSSDPLSIEGLALTIHGRRRVMLANLTPRERLVTLVGLNVNARATTLDETNAEWAMRAPEEFRARQGTLVWPTDGSFRLRLRPYAIARLDLELAGG